MSVRSSSPANDQSCRISTPRLHGFCCVRSTRDGPAAHWPAPVWSLVAVGRVSDAPTPQMTRPGAAGDRKVVWLMSPSPHVASPSSFEGREGRPVMKPGA